MSKWDTNKLEQMTNIQNEFTKNKLNYVKIAEQYFDIMQKVRENGDVIPLAFKDVEVTYNGKISEDIEENEVDADILSLIEEKEKERQVMHIKHFSRSISHQEWFDFLDKEVDEFINKYPEYKEIIIE
jgi:ubiquitin C-terminal hydrolase